MIIQGKIIEPDLWDAIKDLEVIDAMNYLYHKGYFNEIAPKIDSNGNPYENIFKTGVKFEFNIVRLYDYEEDIRQLELLINLKHKYNRPYDEQISKLEDIYEKLKVLNALHE